MNALKFLKQYKHYAKIGKGFASGFDLFDVSSCEICGAELRDPNGCNVSGVTRLDLVKAGLTERKAPLDEGGWSEMHELATCTECCYDPDALTKHASKMQAKSESAAV